MTIGGRDPLRPQTKCNGFESSYSMGVSFAVIGWSVSSDADYAGGAVAWGVEGSESWWRERPRRL